MKTIIAKEIKTIKNRNNGHEKMTGEFIAKKVVKAYHESEEEIKSLGLGQVMCLYPEINNNGTEAEGSVIAEIYVYEITIPKGTTIYEFGGNEYRIVVNSKTKGRHIGFQQTVRLKNPEPNKFRPGFTTTKRIFKAL